MTSKIIGLDGSPFVGGTASAILKNALVGAESVGAETKYIRLQDIVTEPFHGIINPVMLKTSTLFRALPKGLKRLIPGQVTLATTNHLMPKKIRMLVEDLESADGFIIATPTWWGMPSDYVKVLLNYLTMEEYRGWRLQGKVVGLMAVCEEDGGMQNCMLMANMLNHLGVFVPPYCMFFYNKGISTVWAEKDQELVGRNVTRLAQILKSADPTISRWGYK